MRATCVKGPGKFEVREVETPTPGVSDVVVRVRNCGICGSDLHSFRGHFPMMPGLIMGHEIAGEVAEIGGDVHGVQVGDRVAVEPLIFCGSCTWCRSGQYQHCGSRSVLGMMAPGGFAEYIRVPATSLYKVPDSVPFDVAALVEPLAVAVHGLRLARLEGGERVAVLGAGTIGLMSTLVARALGAGDIAVTARYEHQQAAVRTLGARAVDPSALNEIESVLGGQADIVVETVGGSADTLNQAIQIARPGGRISVLGLFIGQVPLSMGFAMLKEVSIIPAITYNRPGITSDFDLAIDIATRHASELAQLVTHQVPLEEVADGFAIAQDKSTACIKVSVTP